jgi:hypothetical protein
VLDGGVAGSKHVAGEVSRVETAPKAVPSAGAGLAAPARRTPGTTSVVARQNVPLLILVAVASSRPTACARWSSGVPPGAARPRWPRHLAPPSRSSCRSAPSWGASASCGRSSPRRGIAWRFQGQRTIVFVDEIHRFNKAQQDAFLPHVEDGTIVLVGATTENPSFAVNAALLSRCKVFRLEPLASGGPPSCCAARSTIRRPRPRRAPGCRRRRRPARHRRAAAGTPGGRCRRSSSWPTTSTRGARRTSLDAVKAAESHHAPLRQGRRGALQRRQRVHQVDARERPRRGDLLDDAHARGGDDPLFVLAPHADLRERGRGQRRRPRAARRQRGGRHLAPRGDARGHVPARAGVRVSGERAEVERVQRGVAQGARARRGSTARCRSRRSCATPSRS